MVLTSCPSAITTSVVQDLTALPSRCTTQAPHCEVSQPTWVPVSRRFSRRNCTRRVRGSTLAVTGLPFTISEILAIRTLYYLRYRLARQNSHQNQSKPIIWAIPVMSNLARNLKWRPGRQAAGPSTALAKLAKNSSAKVRHQAVRHQVTHARRKRKAAQGWCAMRISQAQKSPQERFWIGRARR